MASRRFHPKGMRTTALIIALVATGPLSTDMYLPALPEIRTAFAAGTDQVQFTLSIFLIGLAAAHLILGPLSDRFGRRPVLIGGMAAYFLASIGCVMAGSIEALTAARLFQAVGACAGGVVGRAVVRDIHGREEAARMMSHIATVIALAPLVAPLVGGHLAVTFGWASVFVAMALIGLALSVATAWTLPETNTQPQADALNPLRFAINYRTLLSDSVYRTFLLTSALCFSGLFAFISGSSFVLIETLGMAPDHFGFAFGFVVAGFMVGSQIAGRSVKRRGIPSVVKMGSRLVALAGLAALALSLLVPASVFTVVAPMSFYLMGVGLILPSSMAGAIGPYPLMAGAAAALVGFVQMLMAAGAGALVGRIHDGTPMPMFAVMALCGALCWVIARTLKDA